MGPNMPCINHSAYDKQMNIIVDIAKAVSYTHLDVYKRQHQNADEWNEGVDVRGVINK